MIVVPSQEVENALSQVNDTGGCTARDVSVLHEVAGQFRKVLSGQVVGLHFGRCHDDIGRCHQQAGHRRELHFVCCEEYSGDPSEDEVVIGWVV